MSYPRAVSTEIPRLPAEVLNLSPRRVPRWGRTWSQIVSFAFMTLVFGSMLNVFAYYLARDMYPISAWRAAAMAGVPVILDVLIAYWFVRAFASRAITQRGPLVMGYVTDATHVMRGGNLNMIQVRYRFEVAGVPHTGRVTLRDRSEMRGLPKPIDRRDYVMVAYNPDRPRRNYAWGFVTSDGAVAYPR